MDPETRRAWLEVVSGDDYDQHMATIGQAQVNASLVCQMLGDHPLGPGARLLFVGCGTGQILHLRLAFPCETQGFGKLASTLGVTERRATTLRTVP